MKQTFKVLVADDEKLIARNIAHKIQQINDAFQVVAIAGDGLEALELTEKLLPDVVFTDIKMPELDGIGVIGQLHQKFPSISTVLVSGYNDFEYAQAAIRSQAVDYLLKPVNPEDLRRTLSNLEASLLARDQALAPRRDATPLEIVERVMIYLQSNYEKVIDFSSIAEQQSVSAPYLSRIFREHAGTTPSKYLEDYRMQIAKKLLITTELTVKDIAVRTGYQDPFHFSKRFKQYTGTSPMQYRTEYAQGAE